MVRGAPRVGPLSPPSVLCDLGKLLCLSQSAFPSLERRLRETKNKIKKEGGNQCFSHRSQGNKWVVISQGVPLYLLSQSVVPLLSHHTYSIQQYLLSTYYVPATVLGIRDTAVNKEVPISALVDSAAIPSVTFFVSSMPAPSPPTPQSQATSVCCLDSWNTLHTAARALPETQI